MSCSNEFFDKLKTLVGKLQQELSSGQERGLEYISSIISPELLIFDVRQPRLRSEKWDVLTEREQVEASFYSIPDFLFRDRIYVFPQYLHIHLRGFHISLVEFKEKIKKVVKLQIPSILKIYHNEFVELQYDLSEIITRWAAYNQIKNVNAGEKVIDNVPMALSDKSYLFIKLMRDDVIEEPYLVLTSEVRNLEICLQVALDIVKFFTVH